MSQTKKRKKAEPDLLGKGQSKTELPLLAKVELGLIQGDKAIEVLCKEIRVSEAEYKRVKGENNALETRNIGLEDDLETLEGENAKLLKRIEKLYCLNAEICTERSNLRERLEAIRTALQNIEKELARQYKDARRCLEDNAISREEWELYGQTHDWFLTKIRELGVLLSEPKNEKFRCDKFGDCNMSDACQQCPSNEECSRETRERGEKMTKVKIFCHSCEGKGTIPEKAYPGGKEIQCVCPECNGEKWVWSDKK